MELRGAHHKKVQKKTYGFFMHVGMEHHDSFIFLRCVYVFIGV